MTIVALAMTGDDPAFEELVRRRQEIIRGLLRHLCGDHALADDLAQETFVKAWQKLRTLKSPGAFGGWLRQIAVNTFLQHMRLKGLNIHTSEDEPDYPPVAAQDSLFKMDLENALRRLKPAERLCVVLNYSQRLSHGEICQATGLPLGTVKSHISRGGARLRQLLKDYKGEIR